jgi:hypothetical protein
MMVLMMAGAAAAVLHRQQKGMKAFPSLFLHKPYVFQPAGGGPWALRPQPRGGVPGPYGPNPPGEGGVPGPDGPQSTQGGGSLGPPVPDK